MESPRHRGRRWLIAAAAVGVTLGIAGIASAATDTSTNGSSNDSTSKPPTSSSSSDRAPSGPADPAKLGHGPGETLLTGATAQKVKAAALAAVPGGTVTRVETDSAGSPYEAHVTKSDGTQVTVKVDQNYKVTGTEAGLGKPGRGANGAPAPGAHD